MGGFEDVKASLQCFRGEMGVRPPRFCSPHCWEGVTLFILYGYLILYGYPPVLSLLCSKGGQGGVPWRAVMGTMGLYRGVIGGGVP